MPVRLTTPEDEIMRQIEEDAERWREALIMNLAVIGEKCVNHARMLQSMSRADPRAKLPHQPNYIDDTGNLRSSIGYVLVVDGQIVTMSSFEPIKGGTQGSKEGKSFAESLARNHPNDIALIVVAGRNYAEYVAARGYDVLDSSELLAQQLMNQLTNQLRQQQ